MRAEVVAGLRQVRGKLTDHESDETRAELAVEGGAADAKVAGGGGDVATCAGEGAHQDRALAVFEGFMLEMAQHIGGGAGLAGKVAGQAQGDGGRRGWHRSPDRR